MHSSIASETKSTKPLSSSSSRGSAAGEIGAGILPVSSPSSCSPSPPPAGFLPRWSPFLVQMIHSRINGDSCGVCARSWTISHVGSWYHSWSASKITLAAAHDSSSSCACVATETVLFCNALNFSRSLACTPGSANFAWKASMSSLALPCARDFAMNSGSSASLALSMVSSSSFSMIMPAWKSLMSWKYAFSALVYMVVSEVRSPSSRCLRPWSHMGSARTKRPICRGMPPGLLCTRRYSAAWVSAANLCS
mmetsp:Transcript_21394/g.65299  ORF Transcript_21394/g.65299 Transcript_21394/m.65299 type:complete len:251 (-) Transcript_21394:2237-2989(-)